MGASSTASLDWRTVLVLGRVGNLPSVWSHSLLATVLAGGQLADPRTWLILVALSAMYLGGMFLNDAFDAHWDREHRPERPIPSGRVTQRQVFSMGAALVATGPALLLMLGSPGALGFSLLLAVAIVWYDWCHKAQAQAAWLMGACRALVYLTAASAWGPVPGIIWPLALATGLFVVGITGLARTEHLNRLSSGWPLVLLAAPLLLTLPSLFQGAALAWLLLAGWLLWQGRHLWPGSHRRIAEGVTGLLLALPLLDLLYLAGQDHWVVAMACLTLFLLAQWGRTRLPLT